MHSRKMRTARLLTVSQHALFAGAGGVNLWPGEYLPTGVYLPGGWCVPARGWEVPAQVLTPHPREQNDRQVQKYYLAANFVCGR